MSDDNKEIYDNSKARGEKPKQYFVEGYFDPAYSMPAETDKDYSFKIRASSALPAFPPQNIDRRVNEKLRPIKMIAMVTLGLLIILCLLTIVQLIIKYDLEISNNNGTISVTLKESVPNSELPDDTIPSVSPDSTQNIDNNVIQPPPDTHEWEGTAMAISEISADAVELSYQQIYKKCIDSLVSIYAITNSGQKVGAGIVISPDGYIVTNFHLIDNSSDIIIILNNEDQYQAALVGKDAVTDLAVLKINAARLKPAEFGNSLKTEVGDSVLAIGNPLNYTLSMTDGIISAINDKISLNGFKTTLLQTNAELNEGNSGGALLNRYGQVIGITNMKIVSAYSSAQGMGFAIPIAAARPIVEELLINGYIKGRPSLGIIVKDVPAVASVFYEMPTGVYIDYVWENSDSFIKGLKRGDIIVSASGTKIKGLDTLLEIQNGLTVGDSIALDIFREGQYYMVEVTLMDASIFD